MSLSLHTIKPKKGSSKRRKRVGRGNASGKGTYSGRGLKGQKSRSGVSNLKRLGMKQVLLRTPKIKGFKSHKPKDQIVKISQINKYFKDKEVVSPKILLKKGLVDNIKLGIKILGPGKLQTKSLNFLNVKMSKSIQEQVGPKKDKGKEKKVVSEKEDESKKIQIKKKEGENKGKKKKSNDKKG